MILIKHNDTKQYALIVCLIILIENYLNVINFKPGALEVAEEKLELNMKNI